VLEHDERPSFGGAVVVDAHDVRMRKCRRRVRFSLKTGFARLAVLILEFDGDGSIELLIEPQPDLSHAATPEFLLELVATCNYLPPPQWPHHSLSP
jgi:hypothetical protein